MPLLGPWHPVRRLTTATDNYTCHRCMHTGKRLEPDAEKPRSTPELNTNLSWSPGPWVQKPVVTRRHAVYFGTDFNDVNDANSDAATRIGAYKGRQDPCSYDPGLLIMDTSYYWRIDEYNDPATPATQAARGRVISSILFHLANISAASTNPLLIFLSSIVSCSSSE